MDFLHHLFHALRHLSPQSIGDFAHYVGPWLYVVFFVIIFCETGLVVTPFLPGDSLLFTLGAAAANPAFGIDWPVWQIALLLCLAANCGDLVNYLLGMEIGPRVFRSENSKLLNKKHLLEAHRFYETYGNKTIIMARFVPIIRTFAPFVAGIARMRFLQFLAFSVVGGALWVTVCTSAGYYLGSRPFVQKHFELIVLAIVVISVLPAVFQFLKARRETGGSPRRHEDTK